MSDIWLHASCTLSFDVKVPTPMVLMLRPRSSVNQWVGREDYRIAPSVQVVEVTDGFGNLCQRLVAPVGEFGIFTSADVMVVDRSVVPDDGVFVEVPKLPHDQDRKSCLRDLKKSRSCEGIRRT